MRNTINITGNNQIFSYLVEYIKCEDLFIDNDDVNYTIFDKTIRLFNKNIQFFRDKNDWYSISNINNKSIYNTYIPNNVKISKIRIYIPNHSVSTYVKNTKYVFNLNIWIADKKIDLGSYIFKPNNTLANEYGAIKYGNNEYHEYMEFDIIDPFSLIYSDDWDNFRKNICGEVKNTNNSCAFLNASFYIVKEFEEKYMMMNDYTGGITYLDFSKDNDYLTLNLASNLDPLGFKLTLSMNEVYNNWLLDYLEETHNIYTGFRNIGYQFVIKNKDNIAIGPTITYNPQHDMTQIVKWKQIFENDDSEYKFIRELFNNWDSFEEGWCLVSSLIVNEYIPIKDENDNVKDYIVEEVYSIVSNELPITQELFSRYTNGGAEKIIDINDMEINTYNIVNKIENKIVQLERPNESKSHIIQPIFFKVKELELLTLHPLVTENICINLDDYKSKVSKFILQVDNNKFEQIGANSYGILFKIPANVISENTLGGTYYVLNEEYELVTTGKYNCVR